jgi:serine/threonine-protein kinase RsbW
MSEAEIGSSIPRQLGQAVELRVAAKLDSLAVIRALVTALGTLEDLVLDAVADLRLAVDEACTRLVRCAVPDATLVVKVVPHANALVVTASAPCTGQDILRPGTFSWHVISSLTDDVETFHDGAELADEGRVFGISMTARRLESAT